MFLIVLGAILGWLAAIILDAESTQGLLRNITAGIAGAMVAGLVVGPLMGASSLLGDSYSVAALLFSLLGSLTAIAGVNLYRHAQLR